MPHPLLQKHLLDKNYNSLQKELRKIQPSQQKNLDDIFIESLKLKIQLFHAVKKPLHQRQSFSHFQRNVQLLEDNYGTVENSQVKKLFMLGLNFFVFQLTPKKQTSQQSLTEIKQLKQNSIHFKENFNLQQRNLIKKLLELPTVKQYMAEVEHAKYIKSSLYLFMTFIQLQTKKLMKLKFKNNKQEIYLLINLLNQLILNFPETESFASKILLILVHLRIFYLNLSVDSGYSLTVNEILQLILGQQNEKKKLVINQETLVVLLYNLLKILLGTDFVPQNILTTLSALLRQYNMPTPANYHQTIFRLFIIIKIVILRQSQFLTNFNPRSLESINTKFDDDNVLLQIEGQDPILAETFSSFMNINLDSTVVQLREVARNIVRHRVASLATVIGFKLGIQNFAIDFLHLMYDSPFNNDIQTIKLCFELFEARQFSKLEHLLQMVLSASTCKNLKERQVLIAMCSIFIGIYLQNRQQGLLYAKLNHFENKKHILREQTLLQHIGFAYYNLAKSEIYLENRQIYLIKALQNFKKSYDLNPNNYVITYCMGKIYLKLNDTENAYKYSLQSCKCNRGRWVPFALLACVYMVQHKIHKAMIIIDELLKKYQDQPVLYYIRAYIEVNKLLLQVQFDEQVEAAKEMDEQIYELTKDKVLKSKSLLELITYCQHFYNKSRSIQINQIDQNFFNNINNFAQQNQDQGPSDLLTQRKTLLMIIELFIEVEQLQTAEGLLKTMPENSQSKFYHALIHSKRKQYNLALIDYKKILEKDNMHVNSLIQCSLLDKNNAEALNYITLAGKFTNDNKFLFAKGMILSRLERFQEAHLCFIKQADVAWLQELPEKLYYY